MAEIEPLCALHYELSKTGGLQDVVAPPYDVIDAQQRAELEARSPYNVVRVDLPRGNGDPSLVMFRRDVTPNHHKLAEEFVLMDNLYCNGHVSADGHANICSSRWHIPPTSESAPASSA